MAKAVEVLSDVSGSIWKVVAQPGQQVAEGDVLVVIESMKMEIPVESPCSGVLRSLCCQESQPIREGDTIAVVDAS